MKKIGFIFLGIITLIIISLMVFILNDDNSIEPPAPVEEKYTIEILAADNIPVINSYIFNYNIYFYKEDLGSSLYWILYKNNFHFGWYENINANTLNKKIKSTSTFLDVLPNKNQIFFMSSYDLTFEILDQLGFPKFLQNRTIEICHSDNPDKQELLEKYLSGSYKKYYTTLYKFVLF